MLASPFFLALSRSLPLCSAFFWLLSTALASLIWVAIPPLRSAVAVHLLVGAATALGGRVAFVQLYRHAARGLKVSPRNATIMSVAAGLGSGVTAVAVQWAPLLTPAQGPGTFYAQGCQAMSAYVYASVLAAAWTMLHLILYVQVVDALLARRNAVTYVRLGLVFVQHATLSLLTLGSNCVSVLPITIFLIFVLSALTACMVFRFRPFHRLSARLPAL